MTVMAGMEQCQPRLQIDTFCSVAYVLAQLQPGTHITAQLFIAVQPLHNLVGHVLPCLDNIERFHFCLRCGLFGFLVRCIGELCVHCHFFFSLYERT